MKHCCLGLVIVSVMVGCAGGKSVDGKWDVSGYPNVPPGTKSIATFTGGKNMTLDLAMDQEIPGGKMGVSIKITGTYAIDKNTMTMKADDVKITTTGAPDSMKAMIEERINAQSKVAKDEMNKQGPVEMIWTDDKSFSLKAKTGVPLTFTRA